MILKRHITISLIMIAMFFLSSGAITNTRAHVEVGGHCDNPTMTLSITAAPKGTDSDVAFDKDTLSVPTDTCFTMKFTNKAPSEQHSFVIDKTSDFDGVHIHLMNNTSGFNNNGTEWTNLMSPSSATDLTFYCGVSGHKAAGMVGTLSVGDSGSGGFLPGFSFIPAFLALFSGFVAISAIRKHRKIQV